MTSQLTGGGFPALMHFGNISVGAYAGFKVEILEKIFRFKLHKISSVYIGTLLEKSREKMCILCIYICWHNLLPPLFSDHIIQYHFENVSR